MTNDRERPAANGTLSQLSGDDVAIIGVEADETAGHRCRRCSHPLTALRSVRVGLGPICRRLEAVAA